jgi:hypothetical protein
MSTQDSDTSAMATPILAATSAMLTWQHHRGSTAHCLIRLRTIRAATLDPDAGGLVTAAVVSKLRGNPRELTLSSDFAGLANTALARFIPPSCPPETITWYVHLGQFSSYDPAGPETLERVTLTWDPSSGSYQQPGPEDYQLLDPDEFARYTALLYLEPVDELLAAWPWDTAAVPTPRPAG